MQFFPLPSLGPPPFRFFFRSSRPRPNILKSDLAGLVEARKAATSMNFDILGSMSPLPAAVSVRDGFALLGEFCEKGSERRDGSGTLARAQAEAFVRRG